MLIIIEKFFIGKRLAAEYSADRKFIAGLELALQLLRQKLPALHYAVVES